MEGSRLFTTKLPPPFRDSISPYTSSAFSASLTADAEYLRQFTFRRETVANLEFSGYDRLLDLTDDIFKVPLLMNGCEQNIFTLSRYVMVKIITHENL